MSWEPEPIPQIGWPVGLTYLAIGIVAFVIIFLF